MLYYESFEVGSRRRLGSRTLTKRDIVDFASNFDPLPFHIDERAATASIFGGLIASGLHTLCAAAGIVAEEVLVHSSMTGGAGMSEVRWLKPVRPNDTISVHMTVVETEPWSGKKGNVGRVRLQLDVHNQREELVLTSLVDYLFLKRPALQEQVRQ